jgi:hypothetical protein
MSRIEDVGAALGSIPPSELVLYFKTFDRVSRLKKEHNPIGVVGAMITFALGELHNAGFSKEEATAFITAAMIVEFSGDSATEVLAKLDALTKEVKEASGGTDPLKR